MVLWLFVEVSAATGLKEVRCLAAGVIRRNQVRALKSIELDTRWMTRLRRFVGVVLWCADVGAGGCPAWRSYWKI